MGAEEPLVGGGGYMCLAMPIYELVRAISVKSRVKIWFGLLEPFESYRGNRQKKKKITQTRLKTINYFPSGKNNNNNNNKQILGSSHKLESMTIFCRSITVLTEITTSIRIAATFETSSVDRQEEF